jgi:hypothetical protein
MAFRVARMARVKSGAFKARKGIPKDVRDAYQALYGKHREELFRAPPVRRDNQDETAASIRMRLGRGWPYGARA